MCEGSQRAVDVKVSKLPSYLGKAKEATGATISPPRHLSIRIWRHEAATSCVAGGSNVTVMVGVWEFLKPKYAFTIDSQIISEFWVSENTLFNYVFH